MTSTPHGGFWGDTLITLKRPLIRHNDVVSLNQHFNGEAELY
jgi:hypothetical protein